MKAHEQRWVDAIEAYRLAATAASYTPGTVQKRVIYVRAFARRIHMSPWDVEHADLAAYLSNMDCPRQTMLSHRVALRSFYRWALKTGRIFEDPSDEPMRRAQKLPVPESWREELHSFQRALRASGRSENTVGLRIHLLSRFARENARLAPYDVTMDDILEWLGSKRFGLEYRRSVQASLRLFYRWAIDTERTTSDPTKRFPKTKTAQPKPRPVQDDEYQAALQKAGEREYLMLRLSAEMGLRRAEVSQIHTGDIIGSQGAYQLIVHGKGAKDRTLPIAAGLASVLTAAPEGYLFPGRFHGHISPSTTGVLISRLLPKGVTMHKLRHRFASRAYAVNHDVFTVQQMLGHSSPATTQRYVKVPASGMRDLMEAVSR